MALELNGTTGVSLVQDGVVTAADLSSTLDLTGKTVTLPSGTVTEGIKGIDTWRTTSDTLISGTTALINSEWARESDDLPASPVGTGMSKDGSGTFTFPETGVWYVEFNLNMYANTTDGSTKIIGGTIQFSTDGGSNWSDSAYGYGHITVSSTNTHGFAKCTKILNITDTSNHKIRFRVEVANSARIWSSSSANITHAIFMRLGDAQ